MKNRMLVLILCVLPTLAWAQSQPYPSRPIRLIVPYAASGTTDMIARTLHTPLAERLGQPIVVDNRGGASTVIGAEIAARAPADGYSLLVATVTTLVVVPLTRTRLPYNVERDFAPITMLAAQPYALGVYPSLPATTLSQFIAYAKANPGKLTYGSANVMGGAHLAGEMLKHSAGIDIVHVPYKGSAQIVIDTVAGRLAFMFATISTVKPFGNSGKLRVLGVSTAKRSAAMPDVPTIAETGVPGYETNSWNSLVVRRGTPQAIIDRLSREAGSVMKSADIRERMLQQGIDVEAGTPDELARFIKEELTRFSQLVKAVGITPE